MKKPKQEAQIFSATASMNSQTIHIKHAIFSTFHRVLNDLKVSETASIIMILIEFIQLISMTIND
jgi:hypothetical protein